MQLVGDILAYAELGAGVFAQLAAGFNVLCRHGADDRQQHMTAGWMRRITGVFEECASPPGRFGPV